MPFRKNSVASPRRILLPLFVLTLQFGGGCGGSGDDNQGDNESVLKSYNVHMHVHGHSNHNGANQIASMQWHSAYAADSKADVVWWSDHNSMFDQTTDAVLSFANLAVDPDSLNAYLTDVPPNNRRSDIVTHLAADLTGGDAKITSDSNGLQLELRSTDGQWQWLSYELAGINGRIEGFVWPRPLGSDVELQPDMDCNFGEDVLCEIEIVLAWHRYEGANVQHSIVFRAANATNFIGISNAKVRYEGVLRKLDITNAAELLRDGADNTIERIIFRIGTRDSTVAKAELRQLRIVSRKPEIMNQLDVIERFAQQYSNEYAVTEHVGMEVGGNQTHLNVFLPENMDENLVNAGDLSPSQIVDIVHSRGGMVSLNHVFGTRSTQTCSNASAEQRISSVVTDLLGTNAYGADILEIGYLCRGDMDLAAHLRTWDLLTANNLFLIGTGVTDTHGNVWSAEMLPNPFSTWVLAAGADKPALLDGLRSGRVYFGNQFLWDGELQLLLDGVITGGTLATTASTALLSFDLKPWPSGVRAYVVQGLLYPEDPMNLEYLHRKTAVRAGEAMEIDTRSPSFLRVEVYDETFVAEPVPLIFTNPIFINPK